MFICPALQRKTLRSGWNHVCFKNVFFLWRKWHWCLPRVLQCFSIVSELLNSQRILWSDWYWYHHQWSIKVIFDSLKAPPIPKFPKASLRKREPQGANTGSLGSSNGGIGSFNSQNPDRVYTSWKFCSRILLSVETPGLDGSCVVSLPMSKGEKEWYWADRFSAEQILLGSLGWIVLSWLHVSRTVFVFDNIQD